VGRNGFIDGYSEHYNWYAVSHLARDQGPIIVMIENSDRINLEIVYEYPRNSKGLKKLGFSSKYYKGK